MKTATTTPTLIGKRVRVTIPAGHEGLTESHYGYVENVVKDMFNENDIYLVNIPAIGRVLALSPESVTDLKKNNNPKPHTQR